MVPGRGRGLSETNRKLVPYAEPVGRAEPPSELMERLAAIEHARWAAWQRSVHARGERRPDGSLVLAAEDVARWEGQIAASYDQLGEEDKERDRREVRRSWPTIAAFFDAECRDVAANG